MFVPITINLSQLVGDVTLTSVARGDVLTRKASKWGNLTAGTSGTFLKSQGSGSDLTWDVPTLPTGTTIIYPTSIYHSDTSGRTFPSVYAGAGGNASAHEEGIGVIASLDADATVEARFPIPGTLPTGTLKLRILALANDTSHVAKLTVSDGAATPAASPTSSGNPSAITLTSESQTTITWAASENDRYKLVKVTLTTAPTGGDMLIVAVKFQTSGWSLTVVPVFTFSLIWE